MAKRLARSYHRSLGHNCTFSIGCCVCAARQRAPPLQSHTSTRAESPARITRHGAACQETPRTARRIYVQSHGTSVIEHTSVHARQRGSGACQGAAISLLRSANCVHACTRGAIHGQAMVRLGQKGRTSRTHFVTDLLTPSPLSIDHANRRDLPTVLVALLSACAPVLDPRLLLAPIPPTHEHTLLVSTKRVVLGPADHLERVACVCPPRPFL